MRKLFISIFALLLSVSLFAERITLEDAATVANNFMNVAVTSVNGVKKAAPAKRMVHKAMNTTEEPQYYLYENENGEGWVIIAANDAVTPILAYSETGHFRTDNMPSNIRHWMGKYDQFIKRIETDGVEAAEETKAEWKALRKGVRKAQAAAVVGPLIQTEWDQDAPYNNLCPGTGRNKAYTGCVATAMAQVMNYWQWPKRGIGSHSYRPLDVNEPYAVDDDGYYIVDQPNYSSRYPYTLSADFENTTYDWDNMKNSYSGSATSAQKTAVATLMYHCGVATEMMYGNDADGGSGTYTVNYGDEDDPTYAQNALWRHFGYKKPTSYMRDGYEEYGHTYYNSWTTTNWTAMLKAELDKQHPIMYDGAGSSPESGGHSFICDGYDSTGKFHFNWGWSGSNDGYYTLSNLIPRGGGAGGGGYDFSYEQSVIIGIEPDSSTYVDPVDPVDPIDPVDPTPGTGAFTLLTNISNLAAGDEVILVSTANNVAAAEETSNKNGTWLAPEEVTISNNQITLDANSNVKVMTVGKSGSNWTFTYNGQLLIATDAKRVKFANSGASTWSINIDGGNATIQNTTESYGRFLYNVSSPRFTTYATTTSISKTMLLPQLYYRRPSTTGMTNISAGAEVRKIIENGQVVIVRGNEKYSVFGQKIQ